MKIRLIHKDITDEEVYQFLKKAKNKSLMNAEEWKKLRLKELKRLGLNWAK